MFLDNLTIRTKALIPVIVMALMVLTNVIVGERQTSSFSAAADDMINRQDRGLVAILKAAQGVNRLKLTVFQSLIYDGSDISTNDKEKKAFDEAHTRTDALLAEAQRLLPDNASEISDFAKQFDEIVESAKSPLDVGLDSPGLAQGRDTKPEDLDKLAEGARQLYHVDNASTALIDAMTVLADKLSAENLSLAKDLQARGRSALVLLAAVGFGATLMAAALSVWIMSRKIALPLSRLADRMKDLADGNLETEIDSGGRRDEVGRMASAVQVFKDHAIERKRIEAEAAEARAAAAAEREANARRNAAAAAEREEAIERLGIAVSKLADKNLAYRVTDRLADSYEPLRADLNAALEQFEQAFASVARSARALGKGTNEIAVAANDLSRRTEQQASSLEESSTALNEITARVTKTADGAREASAAVATARQTSQKGMEIVRNAAEAMKRIEGSSRKIGEIIGAIDEIAFQTNLLALNAGVEAARAGDFGRGFAVVAAEVRALAQRAADAAKEIKALVAESHHEVEDGVTLVSDSAKSLSLIENSVAAIDSAISSIAADANAQATGMAEVSAAITQMDQMTQQNASMADEATAASRALATEGEELARLIRQFAISQVAEDDLRQELKAVAPHAFPAKGEPAAAARRRAGRRVAAGEARAGPPRPTIGASSEGITAPVVAAIADRGRRGQRPRLQGVGPSPLRSHPVLVDAQAHRCGFEEGRVDFQRAPPLHQVAENVLDLDRRPDQHVAVHRGRERRSLGRQHRRGRRHELVVRRITRRRGDGRRLGEAAQRRFRPVLDGFDLPDVAAEETGRGAGARQHHPLVPHVAHDGLTEPRIESGPPEGAVERADPLREGAVELAVGQGLHAAGELDDAFVAVERARDHAYAAEHGRRAEALLGELDVAHAVEERQDHRVRTDRRGEIVERALKSKRLDRKDDDVERARPLPDDKQLRLDIEVAIRAQHPQAVAPKLLGSRRPHQKRDVPPRLGEAGPEISAGGAGADDQYPHAVSPCSSGFPGAGRRRGPPDQPRRGDEPKGGDRGHEPPSPVESGQTLRRRGRRARHGDKHRHTDGK